jgi:transcriptional regulator with XRE-family HTH domain
MIVGDRLRTLREAKNLSQGDIEKQTGLLRCYVSRVENGHTVPSLETLEKFARALDVRLYQLMYDGNEPPAPPRPKAEGGKDSWEATRKGGNLMNKLTPLLAKMSSQDRNLILFLAGKAARKRSKAKTR